MKTRNQMQRLLAILFALALLFCAGAGLSAFAADPTGSITVKNNPSKTHVYIDGCTYSAYRVFDLSQGEDHTTYAYTLNADFQSLFGSKAFTDAFPQSTLTNASKTSEIYAFVSKLTAAETETFAKAVYAFATEKNVTATATATAVSGPVETATFDNLPLGYYLIFGGGKALSNDDPVVGACLLDTTTWNENDGKYAIDIEVKLGVPTVDKEIVKGNDTQKADSVSIGDTVNFRVTSNVPNLTGYTSYKFVMTDTMSAGLTFDDTSMVVKIGANTIDPAAYTLTADTDTNGVTTIKVEFNNFYNLVKTGGYDPNKSITFEYSAMLNEQAVIGESGNSNKAKITYSNDPNTNSTGDSIEDEVKVYSFELDIFKYTKDGEDRKALENATFTLNKQDETTLIAFVEENGVYRVAKAGESNTVTEIKSNAAGNIVVKGLGEGTYELVETAAPAGYNKLEAPIEVKLEPEYNGAIRKDLEGLKEPAEGASYTLLPNKLGVKTEVENSTGSELPSTGGMGTTILYVVGGLLIVAAVTALVVKRLAGRRGQE